MKKNIDISKLTKRQKVVYRKEHPQEYKKYVSDIRSNAGKRGSLGRSNSLYLN